MIVLKELNPHDYELTDEQKTNLTVLLERLNAIRTHYGIPMTVTSGVRSQADQDRINPAAPKSKHLLGAAADIADSDGKLREWVLANLQLLKTIGLWIEDPRWTKGWIHFQIFAPGSGKRIFIPSTAPATCPEVWDGNYDHSFD